MLNIILVGDSVANLVMPLISDAIDKSNLFGLGDEADLGDDSRFNTFE